MLSRLNAVSTATLARSIALGALAFRVEDVTKETHEQLRCHKRRRPRLIVIGSNLY